MGEFINRLHCGQQFCPREDYFRRFFSQLVRRIPHCHSQWYDCWLEAHPFVFTPSFSYTSSGIQVQNIQQFSLSWQAEICILYLNIEIFIVV